MSSRETQREMLESLDLIGAPLFLLGDKPNGPIKRKYAAPKGWHKATPEANDAVLAAYSPGRAVAMLCGVGYDVIDVDPRNGGDDSLTLMARNGWVPLVHRVIGTPSGGWHLYITPLGVRKFQPRRLAGIDVQAAGGFVLVPPTPDYRELPRDEWPELGSPSPDAADKLRALAGQPDTGAPASAEPDPATPPTEQEREKAAAVLEKAVRDVELSEGGRNNTVSRSLLPLYGFVKAGCLDRDDVDERLWEAVPGGDHPYTREEFEASRESAWRKATAERPRVSEPADDFSAVAAEPTLGGRGLPLAVRLRLHVEQRYDVFPAGDDGRIFAQPKDGGRAELLGGGFVLRATEGVGAAAGTLSAAATEAAKVLGALAAKNEPRALALRVHYRPGRIVLDLAQPGNTRCVVVTQEGWSIEDVPPADVVFVDSGRALPDPAHDGSVEDLRELLRWKETDPRWPLVKGWLPTVLLANVPRPMLGFFGPQGSSKTTTGRFVVGVLDPKPAGALGGGFGKSRSDDETKALKSYLPAWDNVSSLSAEGADFLSRLVTGELIERRMLYTDADMVAIHYRRSGVITGVTIPRGVKPDTLDRFILVRLRPLTGDRMSEGALEAEWERVHPTVLGGVLDLAVRMLSRLKEARGSNVAGLRMADYAEALWAVDPALYDAYAANVRVAREDMAAEDPFIRTLVNWLRHEGDWEGTAEGARTSAEHYGDESQWWPRNAKVFSDEVTRTLELLKAVGVTVTERRSHGVRLKRFTLTPEASR